MLKIEEFVTPSPEQWKFVIKGMRNAKNSWDRMDSEIKLESPHDVSGGYFELGPNDHNLAMDLSKGDGPHAKYRRMLPVWVTINAPLYWWKEFDTYKVGTVCNSCSTMHKIHAKEFVLEDFSWDQLLNTECDLFEATSYDGLFHTNIQPLHLLSDYIIPSLNVARNKFLEAKIKPLKEESKRAELVKEYWWQMIQLLPSSYNQKRSICLNYQVLHEMYKWRKNHKLDEWKTFCKWIEELPYSELITLYEEEESNLEELIKLSKQLEEENNEGQHQS